MKALNQWCHAHPYKAVLFTNFFTITAGIMATVNERGFWLFMGLFLFGLCSWVFVFWQDSKKIAAMNIADQCQRPPPA